MGAVGGPAGAATARALELIARGCRDAMAHPSSTRRLPGMALARCGHNRMGRVQYVVTDREAPLVCSRSPHACADLLSPT